MFIGREVSVIKRTVPDRQKLGRRLPDKSGCSGKTHFHLSQKDKEAINDNLQTRSHIQPAS